MTAYHVAIRPYQLEDVLPLYEAARESITEMFPWLPWCHPGYSLAESERWVQTCLADREAQRAFDFVVHDRETGQLLGAVALNQIHLLHRFANLGYWVRSSCMGQGIAVTATRLCARFGFEELSLKRIEIIAAVGNRRSQRVAEKAGATREGILRNRLRIGEVWHDAVLYSLIPADVPATLSV